LEFTVLMRIALLAGVSSLRTEPEGNSF